VNLLEKYAAQVAIFVKVCHKLAKNMYVTSQGGNLAWKLAEDVILITPTQIHKGDMQPPDVVFIDLAGEVVEGSLRPTGEKPMYLKFFADRPDVASVIHCHPPYVCATAVMTGENPLTRPFYPETVIEVGPVPIVPYGEPLTEELAENFSPLIGKYNSFVMANHGLVTMCRGDIEQALATVDILEASAKSVLIALQFGPVKELDRHAVEGLDTVMGKRKLPMFGSPGVNGSLVDLYFPQD